MIKVGKNIKKLREKKSITQEKLDTAVALIREKNDSATIITTPWNELTGMQILSAMERRNTLRHELEHLAEGTCPVCGHHHDEEHHHHHHDEEECHCHDHGHEEHHHHHDEEECHCHGHHHDEEHHHHHHDGEECHCHDHEHDHGHHHHHADEVFTSWGVETINAYSAAEIHSALEQLADEGRFGTVLRAKGIVKGEDGSWIHFDYVPDGVDVRFGGADVIGKLCVIGAEIRENELKTLFRV